MAFFVMGIHAQALKEIKLRKLSVLESRLRTPPRDGSTRRRLRKIAEQIKRSPPREVISGDFDAPQFAEDYIALAEKSGYVHLGVYRRENREYIEVKK